MNDTHCVWPEERVEITDAGWFVLEVNDRIAEQEVEIEVELPDLVDALRSPRPTH